MAKPGDLTKTPGDRAGKDRKGRNSETKGDSVVNQNGGVHVINAGLMDIQWIFNGYLNGFNHRTWMKMVDIGADLGTMRRMGPFCPSWETSDGHFRTLHG